MTGESAPPPKGTSVPSGRAAVVTRTTPHPVRIRASDGTSDPDTVVPVSESIELKGIHRDNASGSYLWSTSSTRIRLENANAQSVRIIGRTNVSPAANAEEVQLIFTPDGRSALPPVTTRLSVIRVVFSETSTQSYGYDNMDNAAGIHHHTSVKKNGTTTVRVTITGGATGTALRFTSDDTSIAEATAPAGPGAAFDLTINGKAKDKNETNILARATRDTGPVCARLKVNVYKEKSVTATVAKIYDSRSSGTTLTRPNLDVEAAERAINAWYKVPVGTINLTDHSSTGVAIDVQYDLNGNGKLDIEPGATSQEVSAIRAAFNPSGQKIVIVKDLAWIFYLKTAAAVGDTTIHLKTSYTSYMRYIITGNSYKLGTGANEETITVASKSGTNVTISSGLTHAHTTSEGLIWPLSGLSGNPIYVAEQSKTEAKVRQTMGHECGHALMNWLDVNSSNNLMHYSIGRTDTKIRYKELPKKYESGNENQWQKVSR